MPEILLLLRKFGLSIDRAAFQIEHHLLVLLALKVASVLHNDHVKGSKVVGLESENTIYSC